MCTRVSAKVMSTIFQNEPSPPGIATPWIFMGSGWSPRSPITRWVRVGRDAPPRECSRAHRWLYTIKTTNTALGSETGRKRMVQVCVFVFMKGRYYKTRRVTCAKLEYRWRQEVETSPASRELWLRSISVRATCVNTCRWNNPSDLIAYVDAKMKGYTVLLMEIIWLHDRIYISSKYLLSFFFLQ